MAHQILNISLKGVRSITGARAFANSAGVMGESSMAGGVHGLTMKPVSMAFWKFFKGSKAGAAGERYEWTELYPSFAKTAREEGFIDIAKMFEAICVAERQNEKRYLDLAKNIDEDRVFKKDGTVVWRCRNCGFLHEGPEAPETCPACLHPRAHFELLGENW